MINHYTLKHDVKLKPLISKVAALFSMCIGAFGTSPQKMIHVACELLCHVLRLQLLKNVVRKDETAHLFGHSLSIVEHELGESAIGGLPQHHEELEFLLPVCGLDSLWNVPHRHIERAGINHLSSRVSLNKFEINIKQASLDWSSKET